MIKRKFIAAALAVVMTLSSFSTNVMASPLATTAVESNMEETNSTPGKIEENEEQDFSESTNKTSGVALTPEDLNKGPIGLAPEIRTETNVEEEEVYAPHIQESEVEKASELAEKAGLKPEDKVTIIIELEKDSLLDAGYSVNQISDNNRAATSYVKSQEKQIKQVTSRLEKTFNETVETIYEYKVAITGVAVSTQYKNLESIKEVEGVKDAWVSPTFYLTDLETQTSNSSTMIGSDVVWNTTGYTGQGMKIAVIDTGLFVNHNSFQPLSDDKLTEDSMTQSNVEDVWGKLNASKYTSRPFGVYKNTKIPYAYNYVAHNMDVAHTASDHGTHVAGIAAANKIDSTNVVGVAPDAQIIVMQVFSPSGGADFANVLAAMEDAVYLDVDVMNLSLGSTSGFTDSEEAINGICDKFSNTDIQVAIAAGNDTNNAYNNLYGYNLSLAGNPDIGLVGTPGTYTESMTVASVDNTATTTFTFNVEGTDIGYGDTASTNYTNWLNALGINKEYTYVWLGDGVYGASEAEFRDANNGAGVEGKIALVSRGGDVSFIDKQANAKAAGAIACIVYNNTNGSINMQINDGNGNIPCVSISMVNGNYMISKLVNGEAKLTTGNGQTQTVISDTLFMSEFSSWGVTPSLNLKPDITGVGGNINSTRDNNTYGLMSGTSMATPQVAGATAIVMQYIKNQLAEGRSEQEVRDLASSLLMSTASPVMSGDIEYSPRLQGAGLVNLVDAVSTLGYLTSKEQEDNRPKVEMGDSKDGSYEFSFTLNNLSNKPLFYELDSILSTEGVTTDGTNYFMTSSPVELGTKVEFNYEGVYKFDFNSDGILNSADVRVLLMALNGKEELSKRPDNCYDVNGDGTFDKEDVRQVASYVAELAVDFDAEEKIIEVPASGSIDCTGSITISEDDKAYMNSYFENGIYVDGFIYAKSMNGDVEDLSMPLLGFYGDWTKAPVFDDAFNFNYEMKGQPSLFPITLFTDYYMLGVNPYVSTPYHEEHAAVSKNNGFAEFDIGLLRNAKELNFTVKDAQTEEVYWTLTDHNVSKTYFDQAYGMIVPYFIYNQPMGDKVLWDGTDLDGNNVPENTKVILEVKAKVDYEGDYQYQSFEVPIWVDNSKPVVENIDNLQPVVTDGVVNLTLSLSDNRYIAAVLFVSPDGTIMGKQAIEGYEPGTTKDYTFDITGFGEDFTIVVGDYACNELTKNVELDLGIDDNSLPLSKLDTEKLYSFESSADGILQQGWYSANKNNLSDARNITFTGSSRYYCGEYVDGYIYAQNVAGELVIISPRNTHWKENVLSTNTTVNLYDMAFDYSSNTLYAVGWDYSIGENGVSVLCTVDLNNGVISRVSPLTGMSSQTMVTLGCTTEGQLYGIDLNGYLYKVEKENGQIEEIGKTGFASRSDFYGVNTIQSMAYDHNTNVMYWNAYSYKYDINTNSTLRTYGVYTVNLENGDTSEVGSIKNNCGVGLFIPYDGGDILPDNVKPTEFSPIQYRHSMLPSQSKKLTLKWEPWNAVQSKVTWEITEQKAAVEGKDVITIDARGKVSALTPGKAVVTATAMVYPEWIPEGYEQSCTFEINVLESTDEMYGFLLADLSNMSNNQNTWITFEDANPESYNVVGSSELSFTAATYYNGYVYAICLGQEGDDLYKLKVTKNGDEKATFGNPEYIGSSPATNITDMAFDYTTGRMYVIENKQTFMYLSIIDLETGSLDRVSQIDDILVTLACDDEGTLFGINQNGVLFTFNSETGEGTEVYDTGVETAGFIQSMAYDYNSGNLYWAHSLSTNNSSFYLLNKSIDEAGLANWETVKLGDVGGKGAEISGLFTIPRNEPEATYIPVTGIAFDQDNFSIMQGATYQLSVTTTPQRPTLKKCNWSSSNDAIVYVNEFGEVSANQPGTATITVSITDRQSKETFTDSIDITVIESAGELRAFLNQDGNGYYNWWITIPDYDPAHYVPGISALDAYSLSAGEYYDGYIYGYTTAGEFYRIHEETKSYEKIGEHNVNIGDTFNVYDMAFDYSQFKMIALCGEGYWGNTTAIYEVDLATGVLNRIVETEEPVYGLTCGDGIYYTVKGDGTVCTINLADGTLTDIVSTGHGVGKINDGYNTTLAYDHNNDRLYMAPIMNRDSYSGGDLYMIDPNAKVSMPLGKIGKNGALVCAMYIIPEEGSVPVDTKVSGLKLDKDTMRLSVGNTGKITADIMPSTALQKDIEWYSSNSDIATVKDGVVTAVAEGVTTITATTVEGGFAKTCTVTVLNPDTTSGMVGYAFSKEHGGLIKFNPELPATTTELVHQFDKVDEVVGSTFVDGALFYLVDVPNYFPKLYKMDVNSYNTTEVGYVELNVGPANDMTYDPFTDLLYITSGFYIYAADPYTGEVINCVIPSYNITHAITAVNGDIYLAANDGFSQNKLYKLTTDDILKASNGAYLTQGTDFDIIGAFDPMIPTDKYSKMEVDLASNNVYITVDGFLYKVDLETANVEKLDVIPNVGGMAFRTPSDWKPVMHVTEVELNKKELKLKEGMTHQLIATVYPDKELVNKNVTWNSDNTDVLTVDGEGNVTAVAIGSANVTVTTEDLGLTATCTVSVVDAGNEEWVYGYSATDKAFVRFDLNVPEVPVEVLFEYDAGVNTYGEELYPVGASYVNGYVYFINKNTTDESNLYRWNIEDNTVEIVKSKLVSPEGYNLTFSEMTSYGETLYLMSTNGLYSYNVNTQEFTKLIEDDYNPAVGLAVIDENTIFGQQSNGRQLLYTKVDNNWTVERSTDRNPIITQESLYAGAVSMNDSIYLATGTELYLVDYKNYQSQKIGDITGKMTALFIIPEK